MGDYGKFVRPFKAITSVVVFLSAVAAIWSWWRGLERKPEIEVAISTLERLPPQSQIPDLKLSVSFRNQTVDELWIMRCKVKNSGDVTLLADGPKKNIQSSSISLGITHGFTVLDVRHENANFPCEISGSPEGLSLSFGQWRKTEWVDLLLYLSGTKGTTNRPSLRQPRRELIDGDIVVHDYSEVVPHPKQPLLNNLPPFFTFSLRLIGVIVLGVSAIAVFSLLVITWRDYFRLKGWNKEHLEKFRAWILSQAQIIKPNQQLYCRNPEYTPTEMMKSYPGRPHPGPSLFGDRIYQMVFGNLFLLVILLGFGAGIAALVIW